MKKTRKHYMAEEKVAILRRHLLEQAPISSLCDEMRLQPTVFYRWQSPSATVFLKSHVWASFTIATRGVRLRNRHLELTG